MSEVNILPHLLLNIKQSGLLRSVWHPHYIHPRRMNLNCNKHILSNRVKWPFPSLSTLGSMHYFLFLFVDSVSAEVGSHYCDVAEWRVAVWLKEKKRNKKKRGQSEACRQSSVHSTLLPLSQNIKSKRQTQELRPCDRVTSRSVIQKVRYVGKQKYCPFDLSSRCSISDLNRMTKRACFHRMWI